MVDFLAASIYIPKTNLNAELDGGDTSTGAAIVLQAHAPDPCQMWRFEPARLSVEESGDEIVYTTTTTTVTKVKTVTRVKRTA